MRYNRVLRDITREYEQARDNAEALLALRREAAYRDSPYIEEIDKQLGAIGISLAKLALAGDENAFNEARAKAGRLREDRLALLREKGLDESCFKPKYRCENCGDTGYIEESGGRARCACLKQRLIEAYYALSNMKEVLRDENFDNFDIRIFSTQTVESEGLSPRANMENIYRFTTQFVKDFGGKFDNLLLYGETGLGKTFMCHCIAKDLLDMGRTVLYLTAPRLCKVIEDYRFNRESLAEPDEMLEAVDDVDLLILDDLGAEISTVITSAALFDIINQRLILRKPTVISTNLTPPALESQYSERIVSRFFGNYKMLKFFGEDIRVKKKYGGLRM